MADETKTPGPEETPAPEAPVPDPPAPLGGTGHREAETPGPPAGFEQGVIPGITDPPAPPDKVINLSEVREGAGGGDRAAVTNKKDPPAPEVGDPPAGPAQEGKSPEKGAAKRQPKREKAQAPDKGGKAAGKSKRDAAPPQERQDGELTPAQRGGKTRKERRQRVVDFMEGKSASPFSPDAKKLSSIPDPAAESPPPPAPDPPEPRDASRGVEEKVEYINLSELHPCPLNPFGVRDDVEMQALVESVKTGRVNQPALVRPREDGGYEIIAGHRRHKASELAGYFNMPCIVRQMTDDEAIIAMTDDNLRHREKLLPSEKALAIKQQYEAIKHQGARGDDEAAGKLSLSQVGERNGMSIKTVQRYLWLDDLVPELKQAMDEGKLSFTPAVEVSRIRPKLQKYIAVSIEGLGSPTQGQAQRMRELDKNKELKPDVIDAIMGEEKKKEDRNVIITGAELEKYFGPEAAPGDMKEQIMSLLNEWKEKQPPELDKGKADKTADIEK